MEADIRHPGVSLRVNLQAVREVEQAGPETPLDFSLVGVNSQDRVLFDDLSGQNFKKLLSFLITDLVPFVEDVLRVEGLGVPDHGTPLEDDGVVVDNKLKIQHFLLYEWRIACKSI